MCYVGIGISLFFLAFVRCFAHKDHTRRSFWPINILNHSWHSWFTSFNFLLLLCFVCVSYPLHSKHFWSIHFVYATLPSIIGRWGRTHDRNAPSGPLDRRVLIAIEKNWKEARNTLAVANDWPMALKCEILLYILTNMPITKPILCTQQQTRVNCLYTSLGTHEPLKRTTRT